MDGSRKVRLSSKPTNLYRGRTTGEKVKYDFPGRIRPDLSKFGKVSKEKWFSTFLSEILDTDPQIDLRTCTKCVIRKIQATKIKQEFDAGVLHRQMRFYRKHPFPIYDHRKGKRRVNYYHRIFRPERIVMKLLLKTNLDFVRTREEWRFVRFVWFRILPRLLLCLSSRADRRATAEIYSNFESLMASPRLLYGWSEYKPARVTIIGHRCGRNYVPFSDPI